MIDVHAHLQDERLIGDADRIVRDMQADGLEKIVTAGYDRVSSIDGVALAERFSGVYATVGIHPHDARYASTEDYRLFESLAVKPKTAAVGEIGLDYYYDKSPRDVQKRVFIEQLELADAIGLPVVLHVRDALGDALSILKENRSKLKHGGLMHCYGGSKEMLNDFANLGLRFSFGGAVTFKTAHERRAVAANVPNDLLLLETDSPYLTPEPHRGERNEPKYLRFVAEKLAEIRGVSKEELGKTTTANALALFPKLKNE